MYWQPKKEVSRIEVKLGETVYIPPSGPHAPKDFTADEKARVITVSDFELPFAIEGLQGELPILFESPNGLDARIFLMLRQKNYGDIAVSLRLAYLQPPREGVIVGYGDRYGRINVSAIQFQIKGFVDSMERNSLFEDCFFLVQ
jgi:hypothetical protein